jgi:hypothetical protein
MYTVWLRKWKLQILEEPFAAQYNWYQGPLLGRGPAVEKHWSRRLQHEAVTSVSKQRATSGSPYMLHPSNTPRLGVREVAYINGDFASPTA